MSGVCIAKFKGEKFPTNEQLNNCLKYYSVFSFAYNLNSTIYIHRNLEDVKDFNRIVRKNKLNKNCGMIFKFSSDYYQQKSYKNQPLIICEDYTNMENNISKKPVIVFNEEIVGFENNEIPSEKQFCKALSKFDRKKNSDLFELSLADNLSAMLNTNGSIELYGLEKHDKWYNEGNIFFSNDYYKTKTYSYNNTNNYSRSFFYDGYDNPYLYENEMFCEKCNKSANVLQSYKGIMMCKNCIKQKV